MTDRTCPKCRSAMYGPEWSAASNLLHWRCRCGYRDTTQPADARQGLDDIMRKFAEFKSHQKEPTP